jgi:hypothetical protein
MIDSKRIAIVVLGGFLLVIPSLQAVVLAPVSPLVNVPDDFTQKPGPVDIITGPALAATLVSPAVSGTFTGFVTSNVYKDAFTGGLDFVYQYTAVPGSAQGVEALTVSDFSGADGLFADPFGAGFGVDAGTRNDVALNPFLAAAGFVLGTNNSDNVTRSSAGQVIKFSFDGSSAIMGGETSFILIARTHDTTFAVGQGGVIDSTTANVNVYSPTPEPRLAGLAGIGLFGVVAFFFRRRKSHATE